MFKYAARLRASQRKMKNKRLHTRYVHLFLVNKNKKGSDTERSVLLQIIFVAIVLALFLISLSGKINSRGVRQDIVENQIAVFIEASIPGMSFEIPKLHPNGIISDMELKDSTVVVAVDGYKPNEGRYYFTRYNVSLEEEPGKYVVRIS